MTLAALTCVLALLPQTPQAEPEAPRIAWQRSLEDALATQKATGLPLLIAVNMNGEVFNDRFRTRTYKSAAFVESTRGYVCVVASPDRHNERDYDSLGNRIECPAFPGCTCGEHIAIEPELYRRYFNGNRNAPRHVAVSPGGEILFDRFLDRSMQTAIDAIAKHRGTPKERAIPTSVKTLLARRDAAARRHLEARYRETRDPAILESAQQANSAPLDLIRLALFSEDTSEFERGRDALLRQATPAALADLEYAAARSQDPGNTLAVIANLAKKDERAAQLHAHLQPGDPGVGRFWRGDWAEPEYEIWQRGSVEAELDACEKQLREEPTDQATRLRLAIAQLAFARTLIATNGKGVEFWLEDARNTASRISDRERKPEALAIQAVATYLRNDAEGAAKLAAKAIADKGRELQPSAWLATRLMEMIVQIETRNAYAKAADRTAILNPALTRVRGALTMLAASRWTEEGPFLSGIGLLEYVGARHEARRLLDSAVRRFASSNAAHERWRARWLADMGTEPMRHAAGTLVEGAADRPTAEWFAGYAAIVAAERHVRDRRPKATIAAYTDAVDRFVASAEANPNYTNTAHHFAVLALAGRALARHEQGDSSAAVDDLLRAAELRDASLREKDGLGRTPRSISQQIRKDLEARGEDALVERLAGTRF
ncbi:MAG: hypothetical protein NXI31_14450 [bacterium]|nr:hypothetical protein [bacterium]